ncbi:alpha/beta hydrolase [Nocardia crassostreae]|uniref:alpha/beta hydrolase n=1 Tax=Nocardia crassostreae TaxID=53428 RepID=UPI0014720947|nr:alpha/beta hydrolase [Nocardia crassostreae]
MWRYARELADSCREYTGALMDHLDAESVARDVEALRIALGDNEISLYGRSYGTMPEQSYLELFPERVRGMILDSVDDHSLAGDEFLASEARAAEDNFAEFAAWCGRDAGCALHGKDIPAVYRSLYERAERGELRSGDKALGPLELSAATTQRLYKPEWSTLAGELKILAEQPAAAPGPAVRPQRSGTPVEMPEIIFCSDWEFEIGDQAEWVRLWGEQNRNAPTIGTHFAWGAGSICSGWPVRAANPQHLPRVAGAPPVLILNSRHDPATPHEWAVGVAANTPGTTLVTYEGWGHGIYNRNGCTTAIADRYLIDRTVPVANTFCPV